MQHQEKILIIDFGSQYTQLIARKVRELNVYSVIQAHTVTISDILQLKPSGIILSGGPMSVYDNDAPIADHKLFELGIPILGICYGLQFTCKVLGGNVVAADDREYGKTHLTKKSESILLKGVDDNAVVWMSHGDHVKGLPHGFDVAASSEHTPYCAIAHEEKNIYGLQFHPEVHHTAQGKQILSNFLFDICGCKADWSAERFIDETVNDIKEKAGSSNVICALSGGVDSTVAAVLVQQAIGKRLHCIHIDTGLMRKNESADIAVIFKEDLNLNYTHVDASDIFLSRLQGVSDPEKKRKIIGHTFIEVFEQEAKKIKNAEFLVQGTLYPDVIESVSVKGASVTIKSHHNVGGLPEKMNLKLIEPLKELFKDEVRNVGKDLGISSRLIGRHPFPGPGLAVRVLGEITKEKLAILREADDIYITEIRNAGLYDDIWQAFAVLLPIRSVGVMGDARTYDYVLALRAVNSVDGMTANAFPFEPGFISDVANKIINKVKGINRVVLDISSKPPATIEWE